MVELLQPPVQTGPTQRPNLILHCGAQETPWDEVVSTPVPAPTRSWQPLAHHHLVEAAREGLDNMGLQVLNEAHSLARDGLRYFGLMEINARHMNNHGRHSWVVGLRNAHDKSFAAGLVAGIQVLVCDNLSFSGEITLRRKHTRFIGRDLDIMIRDAVGNIMGEWQNQDARIARYQDYALNDTLAHDLVIRAADTGACPNQKIPKVLQQWRQPAHEEFQGRNAWSLYNAFTEILKGGNLPQLAERSQRLTTLFDRRVGLAA